MTRKKAVLLAAIAALGVTGFLMQRRFDARLQAQGDRLAREAAENARLKDENATLEKAAAAQAAAPPPALSRQAAAPAGAAKGAPLASGMRAVESLGNLGRATPRDAFATQLWAARTGDVALEASTITFGAQARARLEALEATLPADLRAEYDSPEKLMAYMLAGSPHPVAGMQVLGEVDVDASDVTLQTEWQHAGDTVVHQSDVNFVEEDGAWKMVVPYGLVNRASSYLSRTLAPPPEPAGPGK